MKLFAYEPGFETLDGLEGADSLVLFIAEDERPLGGLAGYVDWRLCGRLSRVLLNGYFTGARADCLLVPADGRIAMPRIFAFGIGKAVEHDAESFGKILEQTADVLTKAKVESAAVEVPALPKLDEAARAKAFETRLVERFKGRVALIAEKSVTRHLSAVAK